jgi:soluble lytic murein transglycosylase-like protein
MTRNNVRKFVLIVGIAAVAALPVQISAKSKQNKDAEIVLEPCPISTTLRTADPKLLERFKSLAACEDQLLVAPATQFDYVDFDGRVIIAERQRVHAPAGQEDADGDYELIYAGMKPQLELDGGDKGSLVASKAGTEQKKSKRDTKSEIYAYSSGITPSSLAGTGTVVRIIPGEQPLVPLDNSGYGMAASGLPLSAAAADPNGILAMRPVSYRTQFDELIAQTAIRHQVDPLLLHAVIHQESAYRNRAVSHAGAQGLMQIMPGTGRMLGVRPSDLHDPQANVEAGARLLKQLYFKYNGDFDLVLAAYNAGEGAVAKYGNKIPPYRETQDYVKSVMARYYKLVAEQGKVAPQ